MEHERTSLIERSVPENVFCFRIRAGFVRGKHRKRVCVMRFIYVCGYGTDYPSVRQLAYRFYTLYGYVAVSGIVANKLIFVFIEYSYRRGGENQ